MPPHQFSQSDLVFSGGYFFIFCFKRLTKFELQIIHHGLRSVVCFKIYKIYLFYMGIYSSTFFFILASKRDKRRKKETEKKIWLNWRSVDTRNILWVPNSHAYINALVHTERLTWASQKNATIINAVDSFIRWSHHVKHACCSNMQHQLYVFFFGSSSFDLSIYSHEIRTVPQNGASEWNLK